MTACPAASLADADRLHVGWPGSQSMMSSLLGYTWRMTCVLQPGCKMSTRVGWSLRWSRRPHPTGPPAAARLGCPSGGDLPVPGSPRGCCWDSLPLPCRPCRPTNPAFQPPGPLPRPPRFRCSTVQRCPGQAPEGRAGPRCYLCSPGSAIQSLNGHFHRCLLLQLWKQLPPLLPHCCLPLHLRYRWLPPKMLLARSWQCPPWPPHSLPLLPGNVQCSEQRPLRSQTLPRWWCCPKHTWEERGFKWFP